MNKKNILVTGSDGQLGVCIQTLKFKDPNYIFCFKNKKQLDILDNQKLNQTIDENNIKIIINCAAYTNVEDCKKNKIIANKINNLSVENIARICSKKNIQLIHISTDYVFDGEKNHPYGTDDSTKPINYYGLTKKMGEDAILKFKLKNSIIIRTSWLYSAYSKNFVYRIFKSLKESNKVDIVGNQIGSPTYAMDLASLIINILPKIKSEDTQVYHYSNLGYCSRYEFALKIKSFFNLKGEIVKKIIKNTQIKRPKFSALCSEKIKNKFDLSINDWETSLKRCIFQDDFKI